MLGWFQVPWTQEWQEVDIYVKKLVPVIQGPHWSDKHICFHSDNMAVVVELQQRSTKSPPSIHLLCCVSLFSAFYGFHVSARHVPGLLNRVVDALSRSKAAHVYSIIFTASQIPFP